ncbi:MAG: hypothetical protein IPK50_09825 [Fibrobacterota bacterium]|nr:hypothetical protein [Fibrobacterota bacterium]QQS07177.1 MAG: hypothetical protein IPK50_09825 [Fibrobacterota bacterium]
MILAALLTILVSKDPGEWLRESFHGRPGSSWSAVATLERLRGELDTVRVCREGTSERLDFAHRSILMAGDSTIHLDHQRKTARFSPRHLPPPGPPDGPRLVGQAKILGRDVLVLELTPPFGGTLRFWVDTTLPAVLKSTSQGGLPAPPPPGPPGRAGGKGPPGPPPLRQFLSVQPGAGCPAGSFATPADYVHERGGPGKRGDSTRRDGPRRHEVGSEAALAQAVGFPIPRPVWMPEGFFPRDWAWVEIRGGKAAQVFYSNGKQRVSLFWKRTNEPPQYCPSGGCKDFKGRVVVFHKVGAFVLAVTGDLPPKDLEKIAGLRK